MKAAQIIVLGVAVVAGGLAALLASGPEKPAAPAAPPPAAQIETAEVLVAKSDISPGTPVRADNLQWQTFTASAASSVFIRKSARPDAIEQLSGAIARASFTAGEPIQEARLIKTNAAGYLAAILPSGMRAVSTDISAETGAGGFVVPGDHVDVILTHRDKENEKAGGGQETYASETILRNVRVLAIDQTAFDQNGGQKPAIGKTATLELTERQAETLALGRQMGSLSFALRSVLDANKDGLPDDNQRADSINVVRFGVTTKAAR